MLYLPSLIPLALVNFFKAKRKGFTRLSKLKYSLIKLVLSISSKLSRLISKIILEDAYSAIQYGFATDLCSLIF